MLINTYLWMGELYAQYTFQAVNLRGCPCWNLYALLLSGPMVERECMFGLAGCGREAADYGGVFVHGCRFPERLHDGIEVVICVIKGRCLERSVKEMRMDALPQGVSVFVLFESSTDALTSALQRGQAVRGIITKKRFYLLDSTLRLMLLSVVTGYLLMAMYVFIMLYQKRAVTILPVVLETQKTRRALESEVSQVCSICLENFSGDTVVRELSCRHVFHRSCVDPWLLYRCYLCPLCRQGPDDT